VDKIFIYNYYSNTMKKLALVILALVVLISPSLILADNDNTISYLQSQNQNTWISQALAAAEVSDIDISYMDYETAELMTASKNVLTLAATNSQDTDNLNQLVSVIESSKNNGQFGSLDLLNDDFWAIMALASVDKLSDVENIKNFLLDNQNTDGGWSWSTGGVSDSNDTAAAMMALSDLGLNSSSPEIISALAYLQNTQNTDGGFGYDADSQSDGASSSWVIATLNKFDIEVSSWQQGSNTPISFLESLRQDDGSFLWMASDEEGSTMVTAYALVALTDNSYPINYIEITEEDDPIVGHSIRIEGPDNTICLASNLEADTVLELLDVAADVCDFDYTTEDSAYGVYVSSIAGIAAEGMSGWQYFVDWQSGMVAVTDYHLEGNQSVLWAYGGWPYYPVKLEVNDTHFDSGGILIASFEYYNGDTWVALAEANVVLGADTYQTDSNGQLTVTMISDGVFPIFSQSATEYIRSNREYIVVGSGVSQTIDLSVNIESDDGGPGGVDTIAFSVDQSNIDFGTLNPGQEAETIISLSNTGNTAIYIEASILGDDVFAEFTSLDQSVWTDYNLNLPIAGSQSVNVGLALPDAFDSLGQKEGQLIFWGINQ
jgi:hypothetical protein